MIKTRKSRSSLNLRSAEALSTPSLKSSAETPSVSFQDVCQSSSFKLRAIRRFSSEANIVDKRSDQQSKFDIMKERFTFGLYKKPMVAKEKKVF